MPDKEKTQQFINDKVKTMDQIDELLDRLEECTDTGMADDNSVLYNELNILRDDAEAASSYFELSEIIHHCRQVEKNIDTWLSSFGRMTQDLEWPEIALEE